MFDVLNIIPTFLFLSCALFVISIRGASFGQKENQIRELRHHRLRHHHHYQHLESPSRKRSSPNGHERVVIAATACERKFLKHGKHTDLATTFVKSIVKMAYT